MNKVKVDLNKFPARAMFERFSKEPMPSVCVTGVVDITRLYKLKKKHSLNAMLCFATMQAAERVKEFHYSIKEDGLYEYEHMKSNAVVKGSDGQLYYADYKYSNSFIEFEKEYQRVNKYCYDNNCNYEEDTGALISTSAVVGYPFICASLGISPTFWDNFLVWGRYEKHLFKVTLNMSLRFHHATIDGEHAGMFYRELQNILKNFRIN